MREGGVGSVDVGQRSGGGFDLVLVVDELLDGVILPGEESMACRCRHFHGEAEVAGSDGHRFKVDLHFEGVIGSGGFLERVDVRL